jgi:hypothetical protein
VYKVLVGKPEGKRPLGRPRRRWEDGIRMDLREIGLGVVDWIRLAQDRDRWRAVVSAVMNLRVLAPRSYRIITCVSGGNKSPLILNLSTPKSYCKSMAVPLSPCRQ